MSMEPEPTRPGPPERPTYGSPSTYESTEPAAGPVTGPPPGVAGSANGFAIASLVLGILGIVGFPPLIPSILALIFGYKGRREIDRSNGAQQGRGLAVAGIILGWVAIVFVLVIGVVLAFLLAVPTFSFDW